MTATQAATHGQPLHCLVIWFHLPLELTEDVWHGSIPSGWVDVTGQPEQNKQRIYFHRVVAEALWDRPGKADTAAIVTFRRECSRLKGWIAEWNRGEETGEANQVNQFRFDIEPPELRILRPDGLEPAMPGLGVLTVQVSVNGVRKVAPHLSEPDFESLRIADALDALNQMRRVFARRFRKDQPDIPENALARVFHPDGPDYRMPIERELEAFFATKETPPVAGWVDAMLDPLTIASGKAALFGDERAYMSSILAVATPEGMTHSEAFNGIHASTFFRLAEVDSGKPGYASQPEFLARLKERYFYDRHAPAEGGCHDADPKNSTRWITAPNHLCGIGTGEFATKHGINNVRRFYRMLHILCLIQRHRLLQFSRRIADLVANRRSPVQFRSDLQKLRGEFLSFTHRLHFNSISHQILPEEIYHRLYAAMGLGDLFAAVEDELRAAAEYAALQEAEEAARRAEKLNNVIVVGVPAALVVGALGMNILIGDRFPALFDGHVCVSKVPFRYDLFQAAVVVAVVLSVWAWLYRALLRPADGAGHRPVNWGKAVIGAWVAVLCAFLFMGDAVGPCPGSASGPDAALISPFLPVRP